MTITHRPDNAELSSRKAMSRGILLNRRGQGIVEYFLIALAAGAAALMILGKFGAIQDAWNQEVDQAVNQIQ